MTINDAFFVANTPHKRTVKLPDGSEHEMYFRELPASEFRRYRIAEQSADEEQRVGAIAKLIASSVCDEKGKLAMGYKKALELNLTAANALLSAIHDVNGLTSAPGGNDSPSEDGTGSTTS